MPKFEVISKEEAVKRTAFEGKRGEIMSLYLFFIDQLRDGKAGKLKPGEGETAQAVRRRLGAAAKVAGKKLEIKKIGSEIYFWIASDSSQKSKRGRPKKNASNLPQQSTDISNRFQTTY